MFSFRLQSMLMTDSVPKRPRQRRRRRVVAPGQKSADRVKLRATEAGDSALPEASAPSVDFPQVDMPDPLVRDESSAEHAEISEELHKQRRAERQRQRELELEQFPFVAASIQATGIHPATSRLITLDLMLVDADGAAGESFHVVLNPGTDPGPKHLHGLSPQEVAEGKRFQQILKALGRFIDGRTLICHNSPVVWGFIHAEARRAMAQAARSNRSRNRAKAKRRQRVGHVPRPVGIADTLAGARRMELELSDTRIRTVALAMGLEASDPVASVERALIPEEVTSREETLLVSQMFFAQSATSCAVVRDPKELTADVCGLQRSVVRVEAMQAPRVWSNPGVYQPEVGLVQGMELVVAPEIAMDPNVIIAAAVRHGLAYSEKVTRETSIVVCNRSSGLKGKPMHASRKGVPLVSDVEFVKVVEATSPGTPLAEADVKAKRRTVSSSAARAKSSHRAVARSGSRSAGKR